MQPAENERIPGWGRDLPGEVYESWPMDEKAEPEPPVYLTHRTGLDMDDSMLVNMLKAFGIPSLRRFPADGEFGKLVLGISGYGVDIFVPASRWADACELLEGAEYDGTDIEGADDAPKERDEL